MSTLFVLIVIAFARIAIPVVILLSIGEFVNRRNQRHIGY
jgi:hypothetical protein